MTVSLASAALEKPEKQGGSVSGSDEDWPSLLPFPNDMLRVTNGRVTTGTICG